MTVTETTERTLTCATRLALLLRERNWDRYGVFCIEYEKAARRLDKALAASAPSRAQWWRWMNGELKRLPHVDHCRVLEEMLPGWTASDLLSSPDSGGAVGSEQALSRNVALQAMEATQHSLPESDRHADVTAIFASRTDFMDTVSPISLFDGAKQISAAGLSLNLLCQQFADQRLRRLVEAGATLHALFLQPDGQAIAARELEEGIGAGHLSALTKLNIDLLARLRSDVRDELRDNIRIGVYDETIRFNITLVDATVCVVQPYLPAVRGVDSPTLLIRRQPGQPGLFDTFERVFVELAERSTAV